MIARPLSRVSTFVVGMIALTITPLTYAQTESKTPYLEGTQAQPLAVRIVKEPPPPMPERNNRITFGPLGLLLGVGNLTYERVLTDHFSLETSPAFLYWGFSKDKIYGAGLGLGGSIYFSGTAPQGARLNVSAMPGFVSAETGSSSDSVFLLAAKATVGYNWVWRNGFTMGVGGGVQYIHLSQDTDTAFNGILPAADFTLGFVW